MPTRYLLDTNICIYIQRKKPGEVSARFQKLEPGDAAISVITWGELRREMPFFVKYLKHKDLKIGKLASC
jgi:predicted nucleic acid-binding protein